MAVFVPETGDGLENANSYLSLEDFKDISDLFDYDYSDFTDSQIEARLIRSTMILDSEYRMDFPGKRETDEQALEWPRHGAVYVDGADIDTGVVPKEVQYATVEMFYSLATGTAQPVLSSNGAVAMERDRVEGAVERERRYRSDYNYRRDIYTTVTDALSRITGGLSSYSKLKIIRVGG